MGVLGSLAAIFGVANKAKVSGDIRMPVKGTIPVTVVFYVAQYSAPAAIAGVQWGVQMAPSIWSATVGQGGLDSLSNMDKVKTVLLDRSRYSIEESRSEIIGTSPAMSGIGEDEPTNWKMIIGLAAVSLVLVGGYLYMKRRKRK